VKKNSHGLESAKRKKGEGGGGILPDLAWTNGMEAELNFLETLTE